MRTPWGPSDSIEDLGEGIRFVTAPGHGGYYVPAPLLERIPKAHQEYAAKWSGSPQWYEEDVAWAAVVLAFPHLFPRPEMMEAARATVARYFPKPETEPGK